MEYICDKIILVTKFEKNAYILQNQGCEWNFWVNFFMVYDIDIHELNLRPFKNWKFLDEISLKKMFFAFLNNKCIIRYILKKKTTTISKRRRFYRWELYYFFKFLLFGNVSWITNMRPYGHWKIVSYILYVH